MELRGATVLLLGGSGLVGTAIARKLLEFEPKRLVLTGLTAAEVERSIKELAQAAGACDLVGVHGNIFLPSDLAQLHPAQIESDPGIRRRLVEELLAPLSSQVADASLIVEWLERFQPGAVIDCVNTATALAYRDVYASASHLLAASGSGTVDSALVEKHLLTLELPQLIRHVQLLTEGMRRARVQAYVKIGTTGTGGMGFNIPYTHSEERPSRTLMIKSAVSGAQSTFMYLLGRTPGAPAIIEVKPSAAIGWREIAYGPIRRAGRALKLVDCVSPIPLEAAFSSDAAGWVDTGRLLESVYVDVGENGVFAREEFDTVTSLGQMELVTPEEIAEIAALELTGRPTGRDIVAALDGASLGPSFRGGVLRGAALTAMAALEASKGVNSVAFEMLGPPRLTKLLYEAFILGRLCGSVRELARASDTDIGKRAEELLRDGGSELRRQILSVGIPILLADGKSVLRGPEVVVPPEASRDSAHRGWVDLRRGNMQAWINRARILAAAAETQVTGSHRRWDAIDPSAAIVPARLAVWIFENEDGGFRIKR